MLLAWLPSDNLVCFPFTGESWLARAPRCAGEARASGKFFLIHPPCCSFRILRPVPLYLLIDYGWGAPTSKTSFCLPAVLGLSKMRDTWPWANFLDRDFETEGQSTRQAPGPAHQWTPMELNSTCLWTLLMPSVPCH